MHNIENKIKKKILIHVHPPARFKCVPYYYESIRAIKSAYLINILHLF